METSKALQELQDAADLVAMLEDLLAQGQPGRLSASSMAGMRITMKNLRKSILSSHAMFADNHLASSGAKIDPIPASAETVATDAATDPNLTDSERVLLRRRDLRASIERIVDRP